MLPEVRDRIKSLILRAVDGELSLDELYSAWPDEAEGDPLAEAVYDDVESAVEHYPLDHEQVLRVDLSILDLEGEPKELLRIRQERLRR